MCLLICLLSATNWVKEYEETMRDYGMTVHRQDLTWGTSAIIVGTKTA